MKELHRKGIANHPDPESCIYPRKGVSEALTGEYAGQPLSCEIHTSREPTLLSEAEGNTQIGNNSESIRVSAQSENLSMHGHFLHGNREILETSGIPPDRLGKATNHTPNMHVTRKSDRCVVSGKEPNKGITMPAEALEKRHLTKENAMQTTVAQTQSWIPTSSGLQRVRERALKDKKAQFTALLHHVTKDSLRDSFLTLKRKASPGVDGITWKQYEERLEINLHILHNKIHKGSYRAKPSKRTYIPKADGKMRPLGIAALEDKIVQQSVAIVLNAIYEVDFKGFSYGFRPGRSQHQALDALYIALSKRKVNWVLDADIRAFFDTINHEWMMMFLEHRIADQRMLRLIHKWLKAGVSEEGKWSETAVGTPQGAVISPVLANVYLHYVYDLWLQQWRKTKAKGDVIAVRYADDTVVGFQYKHEADNFLYALKERMRKFGLDIHPEKTRLIEFGRFATERRKKSGDGKPETFNFLGFTHICGKSLKGNFLVIRNTITKRLRAKLQDINEELMRRRHEPIAVLGTWLKAVVQGYFNYHAVPGNIFQMAAFRTEVNRLWFRALKRRSQRNKLTWDRFGKLVNKWIPRAKVLHPYPEERFYVKYPR
jgi:RNA-directed DNA polymerase